MAAKLNGYLDIDGAVCGHQLWWGKDSIGNHFGCGVLAALDSMIWRGLVGQRSMSRKAYMALADEFWTYMKPNTGFRSIGPQEAFSGREGLGVYSPSKFMKGIKCFGDSHGFDVVFKQMSNWTWHHGPVKDQEAMTFIETSLRHQRPVHMLAWKEPSHGFDFHWISIIGIEENGDLEIVTWGQKKTVKDFPAFWQRKSLTDHKVLLTYEHC